MVSSVVSYSGVSLSVCLKKTVSGVVSCLGLVVSVWRKKKCILS